MTDPNDEMPLPAGEQQAEDLVAAVLRRYTALLFQERRAAAPDEDRMAQLHAAQRQALADEAQLEEADAAERARIVERYAALLSQLNGE